MRTKSLALTLLVALLLALTACGGGTSSGGTATTVPAAATDTTAPAAPAGDAEAGKALFVTNCSACHGPEGQGIEGLGKDMTTSEFIASQSDTQLLEFVKVGRLPTDPANTTGVAMPPKGGNPALTDEQLLDIIAWIRTINQK